MNFPCYYAFTVKDTHSDRYPLVADYQSWLANAISKGCEIKCHYYEIDSRDRLHLHGIMLAPKNLFKKGLVYKQMHQRIDAIQDQVGLRRFSDYIQKDYTNEDEYQQAIYAYELRHIDNPFI